MESKTDSAADDQRIEDLAEVIWGPLSVKTRFFNGDSTSLVPLDFSAYANYFERQWDLIAKHSDGRYVTVKNRKDIQDIAVLFVSGETREAILEQLKQQPPTVDAKQIEDVCSNSLNLAARLVLMLKIGTFKHQANPRGFLDWKTGSIRDFVSGYFEESNPVLSCEGVRLPKAFDAWSICKIG